MFRVPSMPATLMPTGWSPFLLIMTRGQVFSVGPRLSTISNLSGVPGPTLLPVLQDGLLSCGRAIMAVHLAA